MKSWNITVWYFFLRYIFLKRDWEYQEKKATGTRIINNSNNSLEISRKKKGKKYHKPGGCGTKAR